MAANILITILMLLPQPKAFADESSEHLQNSVQFYNAAVEALNKEELGLAKAYVEQSLYLNPLRSNAWKLKTKIFDLITEKNAGTPPAEVSSLSQIADFIPSIISFALLFIFAFFLLIKLTKLVYIERSTFLKNSELRGVCLLWGLLFSAAVSLHLYKLKTSTQKWACVTTSDAKVLTGPNTDDYVQTGSLIEGSCAQVITDLQKDGGWVSLKAHGKEPGWVKRKSVFILRGSKFDPL